MSAPAERIMDRAVLRKIDKEAWLEVNVPGMLLRFQMTPEELRTFIQVAQSIERQLAEVGL